MRTIICALLLLGVTPVGAADQDPVFPYGGVYFRKSNPPREDWERDYKTAAELGANVMRHWFMWAVELNRVALALNLLSSVAWGASCED